MHKQATCNICGITTRSDNLPRHMKKHSELQGYPRIKEEAEEEEGRINISQEMQQSKSGTFRNIVGIVAWHGPYCNISRAGIVVFHGFCGFYITVICRGIAIYSNIQYPIICMARKHGFCSILITVIFRGIAIYSGPET